MGANTFKDSVDKTDDKQKAFDALVEEAEYDHGHGGYTGTIAEKRDFVFIPLTKGLDLSSDSIDSLLFNGDFSIFGEKSKEAKNIYEDKWGPALCFDTETETIFCGYASC